MTFNPFAIDLPVVEIVADTCEQLRIENILIVNAPPGAGKSTLLPLALLDESWLKGKKIVVLEPRRLAVRSIAARMASILGEELGNTIGYRIRFDKKLSKDTRIEVVTEGVLTRMLHSDNALESVGIVIFDEFHERSIHADVALSLCREVQQILRPDLRLMIMSATINNLELKNVLKAPVIKCHGRQYPVKVVYCDEEDVSRVPERVARTVVRAVNEQSGDTLVFLPGEREILICEKLLRTNLTDFAVHSLYGMIPVNRQQEAILPDPQNRRKIVLATSIAETSLTIEGVTIVVDSGFRRAARFDPRRGTSGLYTLNISKDSADQRAGRAGRLRPGICYRMWSKASHYKLREHRLPEILEADLSSLVLDMAQWGVTDISQMEWITPPPSGALLQATETLHQLGALEDNRITSHGVQIQKLPCHPRIAHMLISARNDGFLPLATDLAAILEERDPLPKEMGIDINLRIEALRRYRKEGGSKRSFSTIEKIAANYRKIFAVKVDNSPVDPYQTGRLLVYSFPERIAKARPGLTTHFQLANGNIALADCNDDLAHDSWLAVAHVDIRNDNGKIFMASPLDPQSLKSYIKEREVIEWDSRMGGLMALREFRIGSIVVNTKSLLSCDEKKIGDAISNAVVKEGVNLLNFSEEVIQWQNRVLSLRKWRPEEKWPDVSTSTLLNRNREWLGPYLNKVRRVEDLRKIDLVEVLHHHLEWNLQSQLERLAPQRINVPSGSNIRVEYKANGDSPVLAVRIQEVFGMSNTPRVNDGSVPVLMHLLSPALRPIQITKDLHSFWNLAYFEVRKELRIRYAKHYWPEDPLKAQALRGVKNRKKSKD